MNNFRIGDLVMVYNVAVYKANKQNGLIIDIDRGYYRVQFFDSSIPTAWYSIKSLLKVS